MKIYSLMGRYIRNPNFQPAYELLSDSFFYALAKLIPGLLTLVSVSLLIRILQEEKYGYWAICSSIMMFIVNLCFGWVRQSILRFKSGNETRISFAWNNVPIYPVLFGSFGTLVIGTVSLFLLKHYLNNPWLTFPIAALLILYSLSFGLFLVWNSYLQAWLKRHLMVWVESVKSLICIIAAIILAVQFGVLGCVAGYAAGALVVAMWLTIKFKAQSENFRKVSDENNHQKIEQCYDWWKYGWPVSVWLGVFALFPVVDRVLIQYVIGNVESGVYAASYDIIVRGYSLFLFPITLAAHPRIMAAYNTGNMATAYEYIAKARSFSFCLLIMAVAGIFFIYPLFFSLIVKVDEVNALPRLLLIAITIGGGLWQIALIAHKPLEIAKDTKPMVKGLLISLFLHVAIQVMLLKYMGLIASPMAYILSGISYLCYCQHRGKKKLFLLKNNQQEEA